MTCSPSFAGSIGRTGRASCWSSRTPNARSSSPGEPMCLNSDESSWKARPSALSRITRCRLPISAAAARRSGAAAASMRSRQTERRIEAVEQRRRTMQMRSMAAVVAAVAALWAGSAGGQELALGYLPSGAGPFATFSKTNEIAAQIAIDEINAAGGIVDKQLRIVGFDTAGRPDQAVVGVRKLADDDKVLAIIGPFSSSECRVVFPAADRAGVDTMSMASSAPKLAEPFTYAFRNTSDEGYMFERVLRAIKEKNYPAQTAAVAYATDDVISKTMGENVLPNLMKKAGIDVKLSVTYLTQGFDFAAQASQLVAQP